MKLLSLLLYLRLSPLTLCHSLFIPFIPRKQIDRAFSKMLRKYDRQGKDLRVTGTVSKKAFRRTETVKRTK